MVDAISGSTGFMAASISKETMGAQVVSKTIDSMQGAGSSSGAMKSVADYDFQTKVLSSALSDAGKGINLNIVV